MAQVKFYTVDAFTSEPFKGNQAAVCIFEGSKPTDFAMQKLSAEFNLSETAFPFPINGNFQTASEFTLRWFSPIKEVPLCGHATLSASHVIFNELANKNKEIYFDTMSGRLTVTKNGDGRLQMNFPQYDIFSLKSSFGHFEEFETLDDGKLVSVAEQIAKLLVGDKAKIIGFAYALPVKKLIIVLDAKTTRDQYMKIEGDSAGLLAIDEGNFVRGVILTVAPEKSNGFDPEVDYFLRFFVPWYGINEDPATGSAQCGTAPFWSKLLKKNYFKVYQAFPTRGADLKVDVDDKNKRINIYGRGLTFFKGHFSADLIQ